MFKSRLDRATLAMITRGSSIPEQKATLNKSNEQQKIQQQVSTCCQVDVSGAYIIVFRSYRKP